jgi:hypothetical protein
MAVKETRMCGGCRTRAGKYDLIRIARDVSSGIGIDKSGKSGGRGVYVCKDLQCLKKIEKNKSLNRSFKTQTPTGIYDEIRELIAGND